MGKQNNTKMAKKLLFCSRLGCPGVLNEKRGFLNEKRGVLNEKTAILGLRQDYVLCAHDDVFTEFRAEIPVLRQHN